MNNQLMDDIFFSPQSMWKVLKKYDFFVNSDTGKGPQYSMSFSSYPGEIQSGDDFYITHAKLVVMETTTGNNNKALWAKVNHESVQYMCIVIFFLLSE